MVAGLWVALLAVLSAMLGTAGCTAADGPAGAAASAPGATPVLSKADGRRQDLMTLVERLEAVHPDPYHPCPYFSQVKVNCNTLVSSKDVRSS